jgi:hypothetical protein
LATLTAASVVIGGVWSFYTYRLQREQEYHLQLRKELKETYQPLCSAVGKIVSARSLAEAQPSIDRFWELYFGEVHLVENQAVRDPKIEFGNALQGWQNRKDEAPPTELLPLSEKLVSACQQAIDLRKVYQISEDTVAANRDATAGTQ